MSSNKPTVNGIGIINFLKHKNYLITGATGFIGKVFVEKLLREVPRVQKIYLLIRAKNSEAAKQRLKNEIIDCEVFQRLKYEHGDAYEEFMRSKLVPVLGNLSDPYLGMDANVACVIADQIDVIINSAGNTNWHERYDVILDTNVRGPSKLLGYAMTCKKLDIFLHVSTAYVTKETVAVIPEKLIAIVESMEEQQNSNLITPVGVDIEAESKIVTELASGISDNELPTEMAKLGMRRAKLHGWPTTYQLTKAMAEMLITKQRAKFPIVIIRPAFIQSSCTEPMSGWIEGYRGLEPLMVLYGKGQLKGFPCDPTSIIDVVPVDIVVNAMLAAVAHHGKLGNSGVYVYHVASSMVNPLLCQNFFKFCHNYFTLHPFTSSKGDVIKIKDMKFFTSIEEYILAGLNATTDFKPENDRLHMKLVRMAAIYGTRLSINLRFNIKNTQTLFGKMSLEEKKIFNFEVESLEWEDYFMNIHFPGVRKHILKENVPYSKL